MIHEFNRIPEKWINIFIPKEKNIPKLVFIVCL